MGICRQTASRPKLLERLSLGFGGRRCIDPAAALVVDVRDLAAWRSIEPDRRQAVKLDAQDVRSLDSTIGLHRRVAEVAVDTHAPRLVAGHVLRNLVRGEAVGFAAHPGFLIGNVVRHFRLIHVDAARVAAPQRLILFVVLVEQAIDRDVVAIDNQAVLRRVRGPSNALAVVRAKSRCDRPRRCCC